MFEGSRLRCRSTGGYCLKSVTFVAVVYNNYGDTVAFVESINQLVCDRAAVSCVIVDNSDDQMVCQRVAALGDRFAFVQVLRPTVNLGYFGAFNFYFEKFPDIDRDAVVLCNNDLVIETDFLEVLTTRCYPDDVFVVCPDVVTFDGSHQNPHVAQRRKWWQRLKLDLYFSNYFVACVLRIVRDGLMGFRGRQTASQAVGPRYLHMGIGACYVLLPTFLTRFDRLQYPHFLYGEEAYLTRQVHEAGGKLYFDPGLVVQHKDSATLSTLPKRKTYQYARDGYWAYRKFY